MNKGEDKNERLKTRALDAYKKYLPEMDTLSNERQKANKYFYGDADILEYAKGTSSAVSRDLYETIVWQLADFVRIFLSGENVIELVPENEEDVEGVKLMEQKINIDFMRLNNGFKILYQFAIDSYMNRLGVIKYFWKREYEYKHHKYYGMTLSELNFHKSQMVGGLDDVRKQIPRYIIDEETLVSEGGIDISGMLIEPTFDVVCRERIRKSYPCAINVPPEEISFNYNMKDRTDLDGVIIHRIKIHKRKLKEYGFDEDDISKHIDDFTKNSAELQSRFSDIGGLSFITDDAESDFVYVNECYLYDFDEEGNPTPMILHIVGNKVGKVQINQYGKPNFVFITPFMLSHRLIGLSTYNVMDDVQDVQTAFLRMHLNNGYFQNNESHVVNQFRVNTKAMADGKRPGLLMNMLIDSDPNACIAALPTKPLAPSISNIYTKIMPEVKGKRTGYTPFSMGMDPKALVNRTSGGVSQHMNASQGPRELMNRCFAETGIKDLFQAFVDMNIDFFDQEISIQINNKWTRINPSMINSRSDVSIDVGIGTGTKQDVFNRLMAMFDRYGAIANALGPMTSNIFGFEEVKNIMREGWELSGFKNTSKFVLPENVGGMPIGQPAGINPAGAAGGQVPPNGGMRGVPGVG